MKALNIIAAAELELREAVKWYRDRDTRVADRFAAEARKALQLIEAFPHAGGRVFGVDDSSVRRMPIHAFPYHIVFVELANTIEVIAFAHTRRRPAYFLPRLRRLT